MAINYYIIDTETSGLKAGYHEIIQISVIRCEDKMQNTVNIKAEYPRRASQQSLAITKKTIFDLSQGIPRKEAVNLIDEFLEEDGKTSEHRCIVAHNAPFDRRFLHATWEAENKIFPADLWMCTKEFTRKLAKKRGIAKPKLSLAASLEMAGIEARSGAHNAVIDTLNTMDLWQMLMDEKLGHVSVIKRKPHEKS